MSALSERFGRLLAAHRRQRRLTQAQLAAASGLSVDMITKLETAASAPRFGSIEALAAALKIDPAELFTDELGGQPFKRRALTDLVARLSGMSDAELKWIEGIVGAALRPRR